MKARPIMMHARSVQNLLRGAKTQTRRIVKPQPPREAMDAGVIRSDRESNGAWWWLDSTDILEAGTVGNEFRCPYGVPGDLLWCKETWAPDPAIGRTFYRADTKDGRTATWRDAGLDCSLAVDRWRSAIHMPRRFSRLTLELTDVRVERVQDIDEADAVAEGTPCYVCGNHMDGRGEEDCHCFHRKADATDFRLLWNDTNGPGAWERNDWVWALSFRVHKVNVDELLRQREAP